MKTYLDSLRLVLSQGHVIDNDRSGVGMISLIGTQEKYPLAKLELETKLEGTEITSTTPTLPMVTTRKINYEKTIHELIWFLKGDVDVSYLQDNNVPFWDKWVDSQSNTIGPMYPLLWRDKPEAYFYTNKDQFKGTFPQVEHIDQIEYLINSILDNPFSRRHYLSNVNMGGRPDYKLSPIDNIRNGNMALDTCHQLFYVSIRPIEVNGIIKYGLYTYLQMRSNDLMVGKPHNIFQYALLSHILAHVLTQEDKEHEYIAMELTYSVNDAHIYLSHYGQCVELLKREPLDIKPTLSISDSLNKKKLLEGYLNINMFTIEGYEALESMRFTLEG